MLVVGRFSGMVLLVRGGVAQDYVLGSAVGLLPQSVMDN